GSRGMLRELRRRWAAAHPDLSQVDGAVAWIALRHRFDPDRYDVWLMERVVEPVVRLLWRKRAPDDARDYVNDVYISLVTKIMAQEPVPAVRRFDVYARKMARHEYWNMRRHQCRAPVTGSKTDSLIDLV